MATPLLMLYQFRCMRLQLRLQSWTTSLYTKVTITLGAILRPCSSGYCTWVQGSADSLRSYCRQQAYYKSYKDCLAGWYPWYMSCPSIQSQVDAHCNLYHASGTMGKIQRNGILAAKRAICSDSRLHTEFPVQTGKSLNSLFIRARHAEVVSPSAIN